MTNQAISPIILTAFSTSAAATATSKKIETAVRNHFPDRPVFWGYNKRTVTHAQNKGQEDIRLPLDILHDVAAKGHKMAIVQSLHLLPGFEFHELHHEVRQATGIDCRLGLPLFSSPSDYQTLLDLLAPHIMKNQQQAVLLIGHGTRHPVWTAYLALENLLRQRFGERVFVGVVEHYPETDLLAETIADKGYEKVLLIPFFLSHGFHVERDLLGDSEHSWKMKLENHGLVVEAIHHGIGMLPGIGDLVVRHIEEAE
ncbi:sirohydrochlorin cobaltochelatase [Desulfopila aestuarii]|uniref:Sirohydrochlorin cobaltochelatase n=1 Tax=Desulfopila aestuarii DSM 18488 TaxID=1121416 RepID=A0A1M7Y6C9_9BACT|nr:sirohydrochlorin cobaltochelatase [Desulfopila aestuarii]SHO48192.1 sirohydrochlorin cobaltochelatase [Desulfopila aestuarii DSM 18488]